jgi:hypothetical protein
MESGKQEKRLSKRKNRRRRIEVKTAATIAQKIIRKNATVFRRLS